MSDEYIGKEAAINAAVDGADEWDGGYNQEREEYISAAIKALPAAPVREVERRRWAMSKSDKYNPSTPYCPACGEDALFDGWGRRKKSKFCPNCGADMRRGKEGGPT